MNYERRQYQRLIAKKGDVLHSEYTCIDISEAGMKFHSMSELAKGRIISVKLMVLTDTIELKCQVIWCGKTASIYKEGYHFGVQFLDLGLINRQELRKYIVAKAE